MSTPIPPSESTILNGTGWSVTCMYVSKRFIVVGLDNGSVCTFDQEGTYGLRWKAEEYTAWAIDVWDEEGYSKDWVICGGELGRLKVWWLDNSQNVSTLSGHTSTVRCVKAISSNRAISSSRDCNVRIWNVVTGECEAVLEGHIATVRSLAIHNDVIVSASYDGMARIWSLEKKECTHVLKGHEGQIYSVVCNRKRIATGGVGGEARVWEIQSGSCLAVLKVPATMVTHLQLLRSILVASDTAGTIHVWSMDDYSELQNINAHRNSITSMQIYESRILSGSSDGTVKEWNLESGELARKLADSDAVWRVGYSRGRPVAVLARDGNVVLETWEPLA